MSATEDRTFADVADRMRLWREGQRTPITLDVAAANKTIADTLALLMASADAESDEIAEAAAAAARDMLMELWAEGFKLGQQHMLDTTARTAPPLPPADPTARRKPDARTLEMVNWYRERAERAEARNTPEERAAIEREMYTADGAYQTECDTFHALIRSATAIKLTTPREFARVMRQIDRAAWRMSEAKARRQHLYHALAHPGDPLAWENYSRDRTDAYDRRMSEQTGD